MTDVAVDTLRLRGPAARRLARVAATTLPRALERSLADVGDVTVERVVVALDVADHDDETLAVLWADAIRAGVLAAVPVPSARPERRQATGPRAAPSGQARPDPGEAARAWLARPEHGSRRLPAALLGLGDPATAKALRARLDAAEWTELVRRVARTLGLPAVPPGPAAAGSAAPALTRPGTSARPSRPPTGAESAATSGASWMDAETGGPVPGREVLARLAALAELADADDGGDLPIDGLTRAAGLVLLYPWLAEHCRRAEALHPDLDPLDVREAALAAVVDPEDPATAEDPLVRLLAGRPDPLDPVRRTRVPLPALLEVSASAGTVLASFARLLPGFERSSASFVRRSWILRHGVLDTGRDPVLLTAATHPLDVLLPLLPHPVGLLKLPWSPPLTVRFR